MYIFIPDKKEIQVSESTPHLPAIPGGPACLGRPGRTLRTMAMLRIPIPPEAYAMMAWERAIMAARQDRFLPNRRFNMVPPDDMPLTAGLPVRIHCDDLTEDSQLVFRRLWFLIGKLQEKLPAFTGSVVVEDVQKVLERFSGHILWDAALDLYLADQSRESSAYAHRLRNAHPAFKELFSWADTPEASELRGRVLYLLETLTFIYEVVLREQMLMRLNVPSVASRRMSEAARWFGDYVEMYYVQQPPRQPFFERIRQWLEG